VYVIMGHVFICKWKKTGLQWHIWVKGKPKLFGKGETLDAAQSHLQDAIWDSAENVDDVTPTVMEFDPPLPTSERMKKFFTPQICTVYGDGRYDLLTGGFPYGNADTASIEYVNSLYEKGICKTCGYGIGKRTNVEFRAEFYDGSYDGLWLFHTQVQARAYFFSDRFISLLTSEELKRLEFLGCQTKRKGKRKYFELRGNSIANNVGIKGFDAEGQECTECGQRHFYIKEACLNDPMQDFICRSDLPNPLPSCFVVNINNKPTLCMTQERFGQIRGDKNAKGIISERLGIIDDKLCERHPRLQTSFRECSTCSKWLRPGQQRFWELPARDSGLSNHPSVIWLKKQIIKPQLITIIRQEDTIEHIVEMVESGTKIKESKTISFRCPDCWRLGRLCLSYKSFGIDW
jgi:hypothetical protein